MVSQKQKKHTIPDVIGRDLTRQGLLPEKALHRQPSPRDYIRELSLQNIWLRKQRGLMSRGSKVLKETEIHLLEALHAILLTLRSSEKNSSLKSI